MLPMIVAVCLSKGAIAMSGKKVIVKRLNAIQNLGAMDVLCTDKTGTLTEGTMSPEEPVDPFGRPDPTVLRLACLNSYWSADAVGGTVGDFLDEALLATGFPPDLRGQERTLDWWRYFSLRTRSLRRTGSTALNLAYVAAGRFDGYFAFDNHVWDVAGAVVLVREAGGTITNVDGSEYDPYTPDALASNGPLHPVLLEGFRIGP